MSKTNLPYQMSIKQAAHLMRENLAAKSQEERNYIVNHFIDHLRERGVEPSTTFIQTFEMAIAPFKEAQS